MAQPSQSSRDGNSNGGYRNLLPGPLPPQWNQQAENQPAQIQPAPIQPYGYEQEQRWLPPILPEEHDQPAQPTPVVNHYAPRKARATRACTVCRARKQKCDEAVPCEFCRDNGFECRYDDVPLRKQDPNVLMVQRFDNLEKRCIDFEKKFDSMEKRFDRHDQRVDRIEAKLDSLSKDVTEMLRMLRAQGQGSDPEDVIIPDEI